MLTVKELWKRDKESILSGLPLPDQTEAAQDSLTPEESPAPSGPVSAGKLAWEQDKNKILSGEISNPAPEPVSGGRQAWEQYKQGHGINNADILNRRVDSILSEYNRLGDGWQSADQLSDFRTKLDSFDTYIRQVPLWSPGMAITGWDSMYQTMRQGTNNYTDLYGAFESAEDYANANKNALAAAAEEEKRRNDLLSLDLDAEKRKLAEIEEQYTAVESQILMLDTGGVNTYHQASAANSAAQLSELERKRNQLRKQRNDQRWLIQEAEDLREFGNIQEVMQNPDFTHKKRAVNDGDLPALELHAVKSGTSDEAKQMTKNETEIFYYLRATQGADKAKRYYDYILPELKARRRAADEEKAAAFAEEHPFWASAGTVLSAPLKVGVYLGQVVDYWDDGRIDQNAKYNSLLHKSNAVRTQVSSMVEEKWGKAGSFAYNTGMSMAEFLFTTGVSGGSKAVSLALMGTGAAADATLAAKDRGLTDGQAFTLGTIAGSAEIFMESISLGAWLDGDMSEGALLYMLKNFYSEGGEEVYTDLINMTADILISKDKSQWRMAIAAYEQQGKSEGEAFGLAIADQALQLGLDFLGGAASGTIISGGTYTYNAFRSGKAVLKSSGGVDALVQFADTLNISDPAVQSRTSKLSNDIKISKKPGTAKAGELYNAVVKGVETQMAAEFSGALEAQGFAPDQSAAVAEALIAELTGEKLTRKQEALLESAMQDSKAAMAISAILEDPDSDYNTLRSEFSKLGEPKAPSRGQDSQEQPQEAESAVHETNTVIQDSAAEAAESRQADDPARPDVREDLRETKKVPELDTFRKSVAGARQALQEDFEAGRIDEAQYQQIREELDRADTEAEGRAYALDNSDPDKVAKKQTLAQKLRRRHQENGGNSNGNSQYSAGNTNSTSGIVWAGSDLSDGGSQRDAGTGAGEQAGSMAGSPGQRTSSVSGGETVFGNAGGQDLRYVSSQELGVQHGTAEQNVPVLPESSWSPELKAIASRVKAETGKDVVFVMDGIPVQSASGEVSYARGVFTGDTIIVQANNPKATAEQIADHEAYHAKAAWSGGALNGEIRKHILENFSKAEFQAVVEKYVEELRGVYDLDSANTDAAIEEIMEKIREEVYADAYAGINAFEAGANRFTEPVNQWMTDNALGKQTQANGTAQPTGPPLEHYSYAGVNANNADLDALERAKEMQAAGVADETIRQQTGWYVGMDGKWRWEIDDSGMRYDSTGDFRGAESAKWAMEDFESAREDLWGHADMDTLEKVRAYNRADIAGDDTTKQGLYDKLISGPHAYYFDQYVEAMARAKGARNAPAGGTLQDYIDHPVLFEAYPQLRNVTLRFEHMGGGTMGHYSRIDNEIVLNTELRYAAEDTLVHEIQHAIQNAEGFAEGSSLEYWNQKMEEGYSKRWSSGEEMMPSELYRNTAGEIEARDAATRRSLTAEERKNTRPDVDRTDVVFVEKVGWYSADEDSEVSSIKEQIEANKDKLNAMDIVANLTVPTNLPNKDTAAKWAAEKLQATGYRVDRQGYGEMFFSKKDIDKGLRYADTPEEKAAIVALPKVLKRGIEIGGHNQHKGRQKQTITFAAPVKLNGIRGNMAVVVNKNGNHYYAHRIVMPDGTVFRFSSEKNDTAQELSRGVTVSGSLADTTSAASNGSIPIYPINVNTENWVDAETLSQQEVLQAQIEGRYDQETGRVQMEPTQGEKYSIDDTSSEPEGLSLPSLDAPTDETAAEPDALSLPKSDAPAEARQNLPAKARNYLEAQERKALNEIRSVLSVPRTAAREFLKDTVEQLSNEYLAAGKISQETADRLFEDAWENGVVEDREFYDTHKEVKDYLRTTAVTLAEQDRPDISDFDDFKKRAFGSLRIISEGGLPVDTAYGELMEMAPDLFPETVTHPAAQLQRMYDAAGSIQIVKHTLDKYYGPAAVQKKQDAREGFDDVLNGLCRELRTVNRYASDRAEQEAKKAAVPKLRTVAEALEAGKAMKDAKRAAEKAVSKTLLTARDQQQVGKLLSGEITLEDLKPEKDNVEGIRKVYEAKKKYEEAQKPMAEYRRWVKAQLQEKADKFLETVNSWKDKLSGMAYSRETMTRNIYDIVPDEALAKQIVAAYFEPVQIAEAARTRFKTEFRDRVRGLELSRKKAKGNLVSEAHAVQLLGEAQDNIKALEKTRGYIQVRDGRTLEEWRAVIDNLWLENPKLDKAKIQASVDQFRAIYDELFQKMNEVRVRFGYEPVSYRNGYFPHFQPGTNDGVLAFFGKVFGIDTKVDKLPTAINGLTHTFKPGTTWFGNAQERLGFNTAYDAVEGFDMYIEGVSDVIYHTENIQNLRALARQIRYRTSDEGIQKQVDEIREDPNLSDERKEILIKETLEKGKYALSSFVNELDEYTNLLANKKSWYDRMAERGLDRKFYRFFRWLNSRVAANMVAGNISSAFTNIIPLTQAAGRTGSLNMLRGAWDSVRASFRDDGLTDMSDFLTSRRGSDVLVKSKMQQASEFASGLMNVIDNFTSGAIVRAAYYKNLKNGLSEAEAMHQADLFAAGVMADRSKGSMPTMFHATNPLFKAFTQFQLEVNNQFSEVFKDIPRYYRDKGAARIAAAFLGYFLRAWLFNELFELLFGRRSALDPIELLNNFIGDATGYELPGLEQIFAGDFSLETEKKGVEEALSSLGANALSELPFSSGLAFLGFDVDGGRLPVASAIPDLSVLIDIAFNKDWDGRYRVKKALDEGSKVLTYVALPFGGGQISKTWKGLKAYLDGGSYGMDTKGNDLLQYPVYKDDADDAFWNAVRVALMGKSSLPEAQDWVDSGFNSLGAKQTAMYQDLTEAGVKDRDAYALIDALRGAKKTDDTSEQDVKLELIRNSGISDEGKAIAVYGTVDSPKIRELMDSLEHEGVEPGEILKLVYAYRDAAKLGKGETAAKRQAILDAELNDNEKLIAVGNLIGTDLENESGSKTQYALLLDAVDAGYTVDEYLQVRQLDGDIEKYVTYREAGLSEKTALELIGSLEELEPEENKASVSDLQKWREVADMPISEDFKSAVLEGMMSESRYEGYCKVLDSGLSTFLYIDFLEDTAGLTADKDKNGKTISGSKKEKILKVIDGMPITRKQKDALYLSEGYSEKTLKDAPWNKRW